jgi:protein-L-isoaspartate(D-aspartate) O-methyltransferase
MKTTQTPASDASAAEASSGPAHEAELNDQLRCQPNAQLETQARGLREQMLERVLAAGYARSSTVEAVMRSMPRHRFVPDASLEDAYAEIAVITKRAADGAALSCASAPLIVAMMLDQLDAQPGDRILEIGAGTGYNAALLADMVEPDGHVTTVDVDPEITAGARRNLDANGYHHVEVVTGDGGHGNPRNAPYDRIIFTVGAWDIPPAIWDQLKDGGRLVVPLRWRGQTRSLALVRHGNRLIADCVHLCGFVPMVGQDGELTRTIDTDGEVALHWDADQDIDPTPLRGVLTQPKTETWTGITVGPCDPFDGLWLQMTLTEANVCRIAATEGAVQSGLCTPGIPARSPALIDGSSLAYFTYRWLPGGDENLSELGAIGHGPLGQALADRLCQRITEWNKDRAATPVITLHRSDAPASTQDGRLLRKHWGILELAVRPGEAQTAPADSSAASGRTTGRQ